MSWGEGSDNRGVKGGRSGMGLTEAIAMHSVACDSRHYWLKRFLFS